MSGWEGWNSPYINHFLSADTVIPSYTNPQDLNRYSYVNNNPLRYNDPSGHKYCDSEDSGGCTRLSNSIEDTARKYRIRFRGKWDTKHQLAVVGAAELVGAKLALVMGNGASASQAFTAAYGGVTMAWDLSCAGCRPAKCGNSYSGECKPSGGFTAGSVITFASMTGQLLNDLDRMTKNVVHELGHAFDATTYNYDDLTSASNHIPGGLTRGTVLRPNEPAGQLNWQQHPGADGGEFFADIFIAWTYNAWNTNPENQKRVNVAQGWMDGLVP